MAVNPEDHVLDEDTLERIFQERIVPRELLLGGPERAEEPEVVLLGGQAGAGKTSAHVLFAREMAGRGGLVPVTIDNFRPFHPAYEQLLATDDVAMAAATAPAAWWWRDRASSWLREQGHNVLIEASFRHPERIMDTAGEFAGAGYQVRVAAFAVPAALSRLGVIERFLAQRELVGAGRLPQGHDLDYPAVPNVLARAETSPAVHRITVLTRDGIVHDKHRQPDGTWNPRNSAIEVAEAARAPRFTDLQRSAFANRLATAIDRLAALGAIPDQVHEMAALVHEDLSHTSAVLADALDHLATAQTTLDTTTYPHPQPDLSRPPEPGPDAGPGL